MNDAIPAWWGEPDLEPTWLNEPYPLDHSITWREHYARNPETFHWTHSLQCGCVEGGPNE